MPATPHRTLRLRQAVLASAICLVLSFVPLPKVSFVASASAATVPLPALVAAGAADLADQASVLGAELPEDRLSGTEEQVDEFAMVGMTFERAPTEPVLARVVDGAGEWSEWFELEVNMDEGPDASSAEAARSTAALTTEPVWVDDATGYEVSVGAADVDGAGVALVRDEMTRTVVESTPIADASPTNPLGVKSRASWGARSSDGISTASSVGLAVIHHTASSNSYSAAQVPGILRSVQAYHMDSNGWSDIGYNFLVDRFGGIWEGRGGGIDRAVIGAHAQGFNTGSVGVSLIGDFVGVAPTPIALERAAQVAGWRLGTYGNDPTARADFTSLGSSSIPKGRVVNLPRVVGHRDVGSTSCPGSVYSSLSSIRNRARQWSFELGNPVGTLDAVTVDGPRVSFRGWAKDPNVSGTMSVQLIVGGRSLVASASRSRPDVAAAYPALGANRGFEATIPNVPPGSWKACAYGLNQGFGTGNTTLGCADIIVK